MTGLVVLEKMGMLVLLMAVGFAAAKANWVGDGFNQATSRLVANVFLPASILSSVIGVAPLFSKVVPMPKQDQLVAWLSIFFMNNVFVGFPVVQAIFGEEALFCASLTNIPFNILLFSIGVSRLRAGQGQGRVTIREVFSPGLIATLVAVVVFLFQIPVPSLLGDTIKSLANGTVPLSMIIIGVSLSHVPILDAFKDWKAYLVSLGRLVLCPILTYFVLGLFLEGTTLGVMVAIAACPSAAMITILSLRYGIDDTFASRVNFLSTILCAVTLPIMTYFLL